MEGWSSPWAARVERPDRSVVEVILERQEAARGRCYRRRRNARRLALVALLAVVASVYVPFGWVPFWLGVIAGSRAVWVWLLAAHDDFEGSVNVAEVLAESD